MFVVRKFHFSTIPYGHAVALALILTTAKKFAEHEMSSLIKTGFVTNQSSICCMLLVTGIQLLFAYPENHVEIWLVILFSSWNIFHAKQFCCA